jgi:hypothetical protein
VLSGVMLYEYQNSAGAAVQHHILFDIGAGHIAAVNILHQRAFFTKGNV